MDKLTADQRNLMKLLNHNYRSVLNRRLMMKLKTKEYLAELKEIQGTKKYKLELDSEVLQNENNIANLKRNFQQIQFNLFKRPPIKFHML